MYTYIHIYVYVHVNLSHFTPELLIPERSDSFSTARARLAPPCKTGLRQVTSKNLLITLQRIS